MVVITGTQRSGTSIMAKFVKECGYNLGTEFWDDRIDGGLESPDVCNFFRDSLADNTFPFSKYWDMIDEQMFHSFLHIPYPVVKFSYLLMRPVFVDMWYEARGNQDEFIIMWRDPEKIIASKDGRDYIFKMEDWKELNLTTSTLILNRIDSLNRMKKYDMRVKVVTFPPKKKLPVSDIIEFSGLKNLSEDIWNKLYDVKKIHF